MVGLAGFEPAASCTRGRRSTKLSHGPKNSGGTYLSRIEFERKEKNAICHDRRFRPIDVEKTGGYSAQSSVKCFCGVVWHEKVGGDRNWRKPMAEKSGPEAGRYS